MNSVSPFINHGIELNRFRLKLHKWERQTDSIANDLLRYQYWIDAPKPISVASHEEQDYSEPTLENIEKTMSKCERVQESIKEMNELYGDDFYYFCRWRRTWDWFPCWLSGVRRFTERCFYKIFMWFCEEEE